MRRDLNPRPFVKRRTLRQPSSAPFYCYLLTGRPSGQGIRWFWTWMVLAAPTILITLRRHPKRSAGCTQQLTLLELSCLLYLHHYDTSPQIVKEFDRSWLCRSTYYRSTLDRCIQSIGTNVAAIITCGSFSSNRYSSQFGLKLSQIIQDSDM